MNTALEPLKFEDQSALEHLEQVIADGVAKFRAAGLALATIRDHRLYRATHGTFEDYCRDRWSWSRQRAHQIVECAAVVASLPEKCQPLVDNERQARELAKVEPEAREEVLTKAAAAGPVTAAAIKTAAAELSTEPVPRQVIAAPALPEDPRSREFRVSRRMQEIKTDVKDFLTSLNPHRKDLIQAALTLKHLAAELERAAAELPE